MYRKKADKEIKPDPIREFAIYLKNSRVLMNISFEELARYSRINKSHLRGIEEGNHDEYMNKTYARGFIKAYADCIGLDVDDTISRYNNALQKYMQMNKMNILKRYKKLLPLFLVSLIILSAILLTVKTGFFKQGITDPGKSSSIKNTNKEAVTEAEKGKGPEEGEPLQEQNTLKICSEDNIVVSLMTEEGIISEEILMPDDCRTYRFESYIIISVSDLSKAHISHNNEDIIDKLRNSSKNNILINYKLEALK